MQRAARLACASLAIWSTCALAGDIRLEGRFVSTVPTGTPPLEVASTTRVDNLNAELLDGLPAGAFAASVGNVVHVGKTGADFSSIQAAIDSIIDAASDNWYVIVIGPGVFDESVTLKSYVSLIGHGDFETVIRDEGAGDRTAVTGASLSFISDLGLTAISTDGGTAIGYVRSAGGLPLSRLTRTRIIVQSTTGGVTTGVKVSGNTSVTLRDSTIFPGSPGHNMGILLENDGRATVQNSTISGSTSSTFNIGVRMATDSGSLSVSNSSIAGTGGANGYGILSDTGNISIRDSSLTGNGISQGVGVSMSGGSATIHHSQFTGSHAALNPAGGTIDIAYSEVGGGLGSIGNITCIGLYDPNLAAVGC